MRYRLKFQCDTGGGGGAHALSSFVGPGFAQMLAMPLTAMRMQSIWLAVGIVSGHAEIRTNTPSAPRSPGLSCGVHNQINAEAITGK
jgi:hypothetical protein